MKYLIAAACFALTAPPSLAQEPAKPYAPQEFDFNGLEPVQGHGVVESVQPVPRKDPLQPDVFEHASRLVIRLDDGAGVTLTHDGPQRFEPGQRVRVFVGRRMQIIVPAGS